MTMSGSSQRAFPFQGGVTPDAVEIWKKKLAELDSKISEMERKKDAFKRQIDLAEALFALLESQAPEVQSFDVPAAPTVAASTNGGGRIIVHNPPTLSKISGLNNVISTVESVILSCEFGIDPYSLREFIHQSPLKKKLSEGDKGFYHAIDRLRQRGVIFKQNGRFFSGAALARLNAKIQEGWIDESPPHSSRSPMGEEVLKIISESPGVTSGQVIERLLESEEFHAQLSPRSTVGYNVIARLVARGQIEKREGKLFPA
jgi:hypothetical protein